MTNNGNTPTRPLSPIYTKLIDSAGVITARRSVSNSTDLCAQIQYDVNRSLESNHAHAAAKLAKLSAIDDGPLMGGYVSETERVFVFMREMNKIEVWK